MTDWGLILAVAGIGGVFLFWWYLDYQRYKKEKAFRKMKAMGDAGHRWTHTVD